MGSGGLSNPFIYFIKPFDEIYEGEQLPGWH